VRYDPAKVTPDQMLKAIDKLDYTGKIVPNEDAASAS
jgi:hypothetical protein